MPEWYPAILFLGAISLWYQVVSGQWEEEMIPSENWFLGVLFSALLLRECWLQCECKYWGGWARAAERRVVTVTTGPQCCPHLLTLNISYQISINPSDGVSWSPSVLVKWTVYWTTSERLVVSVTWNSFNPLFKLKLISNLHTTIFYFVCKIFTHIMKNFL